MKTLKKTFKITAFILITVILCTTLCSCKELDNAKNNRAIISQTDNGYIYFRNSTYKPLPQCEDFSPTFSLSGSVTEYDVPVMLKDIFGIRFRYTEDLRFLYYYGCYYCREDIYDDYCDKILNYKLDNYSTLKTEYNVDTDTVIETYILLTEEQQNAVKETLKNEAIVSKQDITTSDYVSLQLCDKETEFIRDLGYLNLTPDGEIYISLEEKYYAHTVYKVADEYYSVLSELFVSENWIVD